MPAGGCDVSVLQYSTKVLDDISIYLNKAVVYLDDVSAEVIHWHGGATMLFNYGVLDIREFSSFESSDAAQPKVVFFVSGPLSDVAVLDKLQAIISASRFIEVFIFTTVCSSMHSIIEYGPVGVTDDDLRAFNLYQSQILSWMQEDTRLKSTVELHYLPFVMAPISSSLFVMPAVHDVFPLLQTDIDYILQSQHKGDKLSSGAVQSEVDFASLPKLLQLKLKLLACYLNSALEVFGCSEDIFSLGQTSSIVATELAGLSWAKNRKKNAQRKASLLLVDRTLDIASAIGHFHETLLDKMVAILPHLPGHCTDVAVDMSPVCATVSNPDYQLVAPGCLGHPDDPVSSSLLNALAVLKPKEALMELNRLLAEAVGKESFDVSGSVTRPGKGASVEQLASQLHRFRGNEKSVRRHCGLLQLASAAVQVLRHSGNAKTDSLLAEEKGLLQCVGDEDSPSVFDQLVKTIRKQLKLVHDERTHSVTDILLLVTFIYSMIDSKYSVSQQDTAALETALTQLLTECHENCETLISDLDNASAPKVTLVKLTVGEKGSEEDCFKAVQVVLQKLSNLHRSRDAFKQYRDVFEPGSLSSQARLKPLLKQVVEDVVDPSRPELVDISHKSAGFGDLLKSGFGFFRSVGKPRPGDHPLLIIFVIGGTTSTELRQIRDVVASAKTNLQVILGSTALVSPTDTLHRLLVQDNLHPSSTL